MRGFAHGREVLDLPFLPPHELLHNELSDNGSTFLRLQELIEDGGLPPTYHQHPVVCEADGR
eukprot:11182678-Alexandrium_andersonii.AAC.1